MFAYSLEHHESHINARHSMFAFLPKKLYLHGLGASCDNTHGVIAASGNIFSIRACNFVLCVCDYHTIWCSKNSVCENTTSGYISTSASRLQYPLRNHVLVDTIRADILHRTNVQSNHTLVLAKALSCCKQLRTGLYLERGQGLSRARTLSLPHH